MKRRCVFLDRDGVINVKAKPSEYIRTWEEFHFLPGIVDWIRLFNLLDLLVIVVTNQRGVARGLMTADDVAEIHRRMTGQIAAQGGRIDDIFCCPHEEGACSCRKPRPGMVLEACDRWNIDLSGSLLIGDSDSDEQLALACGLRFVRVRDGRITHTPLPVPESAR
ncbi:MAG: HAD family hydrolase [Candidatus Solibacter sp.]